LLLSVLALLTLAWSFITQFEVAAVAAILALYLYFGQKRFASFLKARFVPGIWLLTLAVSAIWQLRLFAGPWQFFLDAPAGYANPLLILIKCLLPLPLCALAAHFAVVKPSLPPRMQVSFVLLLFAAAIVFWGQRTPGQCLIEAGHLPAEILQLVNEQKGEVLWIDGSPEAWYMLGRPQWATPLQGIPIVFSSALANEWRNRTQSLMSLRLADQKSFARWSDLRRADRPQFVAARRDAALRARRSPRMDHRADRARCRAPCRASNDPLAITRPTIQIDQSRWRLCLARN
jgi:hypothetical protein